MRIEQLEDRLTPATLDLSGAASGVTITLTSAGTVGFNGTVSGGMTGAFANIDDIVGSSFSDTLKGIHAAANWNTGGSYLASGKNLSFSGIETLTGGVFADTFLVSDGGSVVSVNGNTGNDQILYSSLETVVVTITGTNAGSSGSLSFASCESVTLTGGNDQITFNASGKLTGSLAADTGNDILEYSSGITFGVRVNLPLSKASLVTGSTNGFESVVGSSGADILIGDGNNNNLIGEGGNDIIVGNSGDDTILGGDGYNILIGGEGADSLSAGTGGTIFIGGVTTYDGATYEFGTYDPYIAILAEWSRASVPVATRWDRINGTATDGANGTYKFDSVTIVDDADDDFYTMAADDREVVS